MLLIQILSIPMIPSMTVEHLAHRSAHEIIGHKIYAYLYYVGVSVHLVEKLGVLFLKVWILVLSGMLPRGSRVNTDGHSLLRMLDFCFMSALSLST